MIKETVRSVGTVLAWSHGREHLATSLAQRSCDAGIDEACSLRRGCERGIVDSCRAIRSVHPNAIAGLSTRCNAGDGVACGFLEEQGFDPAHLDAFPMRPRGEQVRPTPDGRTWLHASPGKIEFRRGGEIVQTIPLVDGVTAALDFAHWTNDRLWVPLVLANTEDHLIGFLDDGQFEPVPAAWRRLNPDRCWNPEITGDLFVLNCQRKVEDGRREWLLRVTTDGKVLPTIETTRYFVGADSGWTALRTGDVRLALLGPKDAELRPVPGVLEDEIPIFWHEGKLITVRPGEPGEPAIWRSLDPKRKKFRDIEPIARQVPSTSDGVHLKTETQFTPVTPTGPGPTIQTRFLNRADPVALHQLDGVAIGGFDTVIWWYGGRPDHPLIAVFRS